MVAVVPTRGGPARSSTGAAARSRSRAATTPPARSRPERQQPGAHVVSASGSTCGRQVHTRVGHGERRAWRRARRCPSRWPRSRAPRPPRSRARTNPGPGRRRATARARSRPRQATSPAAAATGANTNRQSLPVSDRRFDHQLALDHRGEAAGPIAADPLEQAAEVRPVGAVPGEVEQAEQRDEDDGADCHQERRCAIARATDPGPRPRARGPAARPARPRRRRPTWVPRRSPARQPAPPASPGDPGRSGRTCTAAMASTIPAVTKKAKVTLLMPVNRPATIGESPNTVESCSRESSSTTLTTTTRANPPSRSTGGAHRPPPAAQRCTSRGQRPDDEEDPVGTSAVVVERHQGGEVGPQGQGQDDQRGSPSQGSNRRHPR